MRETVKRRFASPAKNKTSGLSHAVYWLVSFSFCIWLFWLLFTSTHSGIITAALSDAMQSFLGKSAYLFPFLLLYGLVAILLNLNKPHKGALTLGAGIFMILGAVSALISLRGDKFDPELFNGGWAGNIINSVLSKMFDDIGAALGAAVIFFSGVQLLFKISWKKAKSRRSDCPRPFCQS
jgi:hypothetical protein